MPIYELPENRPGIKATFEGLCRSFTPDCIPDLRKGVDAAMERLSRLGDSYLGPNLEVAQQLAKRIYYLIDHYREYPVEKHPLIVGAIRYFIIEKDQVPDLKPITGLDDDVKIINYVLAQLGIEGMFIEDPQSPSV